MKQAKKVIRRMCLSNWGGISHQMLSFHEYVNLFSGKSGSGKSTVMDAIQVLMYGSFHQSFLNKAAEDSKNKRSVLSYLKGAQKDGSFNRGGADFCSVIAMEIEDVGKENSACIGVAFEVRKNDSELKKYTFFSHAGKMPENEYLTPEGIPFSNKEIGKYIKGCLLAGMKFGRGEINRTYPSAEAYRRTLYDVILGDIDGSRFTVMEKSAIALRMSSGTGQFIRDYMFPKSQSDAIGRLSEQLGAYREIREKLDDMKQRITMLLKIRDCWKEKSMLEAEILQAEKVIRYIDIMELKGKLASAQKEQKENQEKQEQEENSIKDLQVKRDQLLEEKVQLLADLKSGDLGSRKEKLLELKKREKILAQNSRRWQDVLDGLGEWEKNAAVNDYLSSRVTAEIAILQSGKFTEKNCVTLKNLLAEEKKNIEERMEEIALQYRVLSAEYEEKKQQIEDMKNNRKTYPEELKQARRLLQEKLSSRLGKTARVFVFADLFDVTDPEWKNAIEGRLGRLKYSLITRPEHAHDAAVIFQKMGHFQNVELIHSQRMADSGQKAKENSLYEAVTTEDAYVDACLRRYLGHIIKCRSVEELEAVPDGVTPDCYSTGSFIFRHLRKEDYTKRACIGRSVLRERLMEYEQELSLMEEKRKEYGQEISSLKLSREYESLKGEALDYREMFQSRGELLKLKQEKEHLEKEMEALKNGEYAKQQKKLEEKEQELSAINEELAKMESAVTKLKVRDGILQNEIKGRTERIALLNEGFSATDVIRARAEKELEKRSSQAAKNRLTAENEQRQEKRSKLEEAVINARLSFISAYPSCGLHGGEKSDEAYEQMLLDYQKNYEPEYLQEFDKQYEQVYKSLRDNVIATIHGDIKAAKRHEYEINKMLSQTNFSDSTYQIDIAPADNENGQFYEMLMAEELDSKNIENRGFDGQLSFGEDVFYQKYENQIRLLTEKFMPPRGQEEEFLLAKHREEMEQYADYRNYLSFRMYERVVEKETGTIRKNYVDEMAGRDSGGEGQNPKYVALLAGFAMLYANQSTRDSRIRLVLLDEAFSKMDQERSAVCLKYARMMDLQLIVCVPDERLQSLIRNVDCVYGFRRHQNRIGMMHIDKGAYLDMVEGHL